MAALQQSEARVTREVEKNLPDLRIKLRNAYDAAFKRLKAFRAIVAFNLNAGDDVDLGYELIPPPPPLGPPLPSLPLTVSIEPQNRSVGLFELRCTSAAFVQIQTMRTRALADPGDAYAMLWKAAEALLAEARDSSIPTIGHESGHEGFPILSSLSWTQVGPARFLFLRSPAARVVLLLIVVTWSEGHALEKLKAVQSRLEAGEWDRAIAELGDYVKLDDRACNYSIRAIEKQLLEPAERHDALARLHTRLSRAVSSEPIYIGDVREVWEEVKPPDAPPLEASQLAAVFENPYPEEYVVLSGARILLHTPRQKEAFARYVTALKESPGSAPRLIPPRSRSRTETPTIIRGRAITGARGG
jgi:hypothetical protein